VHIRVFVSYSWSAYLLNFDGHPRRAFSFVLFNDLRYTRLRAAADHEYHTNACIRRINEWVRRIFVYS